MNFHPLLVHFPIALWSVYALLEIATLWWRRFDARVRWLKGVLVVLGTIAAVPTIIFGGYAEELIGKGASERIHRLIEAHEAFALSAFVVFLVISLAYAFYLTHNPERVALVFSRWGWGVYVRRLYDWKVLLAQHMVERWFVKVLAAVGLVLLTIAGALGAAVAHGTESDILVSAVVDWLGL